MKPLVNSKHVEEVRRHRVCGGAPKGCVQVVALAQYRTFTPPPRDEEALEPIPSQNL